IARQMHSYLYYISNGIESLGISIDLNSSTVTKSSNEVSRHGFPFDIDQQLWSFNAFTDCIDMGKQFFCDQTIVHIVFQIGV
ncbi:MAG: hypothetical protein Q4D77_00005, partial [Peptostreptococcaceae bacterium]|nr:hypothetical protein [Peptostreptococcaceae bacterium]